MNQPRPKVGVGVYTSVSGGARMMKALGAQVQEGRKNSE
jgi:hypothetical protein